MNGPPAGLPCIFPIAVSGLAHLWVASVSFVNDQIYLFAANEQTYNR